MMIFFNDVKFWAKFTKGNARCLGNSLYPWFFSCINAPITMPRKKYPIEISCGKSHFWLCSMRQYEADFVEQTDAY